MKRYVLYIHPDMEYYAKIAIQSLNKDSDIELVVSPYIDKEKHVCYLIDREKCKLNNQFYLI